MWFSFSPPVIETGWKKYLLVWHKDQCCYRSFYTQSVSECIRHPPDFSPSHFLHLFSTHANSYSSSDPTQWVLYLTLIKPFSLHRLERVEWLFLVDITPSTFPVRAETFFTGWAHSSTRRESLQTKQKAIVLFAQQWMDPCLLWLSAISHNTSFNYYWRIIF